MIHHLADCQAQVPESTNIWQFCVVLPKAQIGENCNICSHCFIENEAVIGNNVTIKNGVQVWDGITIEDNVFVGSNVSFGNDRYPRSRNKNWVLEKTVVRNGASIGGGSTIRCGVTIGENAMIGAGSVVTKDVPAGELWFGNPARFVRKADPYLYPKSKYGLNMRLVEENDAEFILSLRTDPKLSRFIHPTENNEEKQRAYIRGYKEREMLGKDYYFIYYLHEEPVGVARIYHVEENTFTFGSWLFKEGLPYWVSIAGAIMAREFAFEELGKEKEIEADGTHEDNKGVVSFSRMLGMNFDSFKMDEKGKYLTGYMLKEDFEKNKQRFIRTFPNK